MLITADHSVSMRLCAICLGSILLIARIDSLRRIATLIFFLIRSTTSSRLPALLLLRPVLGDLLRELTSHADRRSVLVEVIDRTSDEEGQDGENGGSPFFRVFLADVGIHCSPQVLAKQMVRMASIIRD